MKWNTYNEYLDECSTKFASGIVEVYSKRRYRKLSQEQKFELITTYMCNYVRRNIDAKARWAAARKISDCYTEQYVDPMSAEYQESIYDLMRLYLSAYRNYHVLAQSSGLDDQLLSERTQTVIKFVDENLSNKQLFEENFQVFKKNEENKFVPGKLSKVLTSVFHSKAKEESQPGE